MPKALQITPAIKAAIAKSTGDAEFDTSKVSVFESIMLNLLPFSKRGLFKGAVTTENTLRQMAAFARGGGFVPLHTLHEQGYELPVGRVFDAEVVTNESGLPELRGLFFIDNEHTKLVSGVDTGSIEEVSVGLASQHLNCSVCGFDYLGPEATSDNIWSLTCNNDHEIGVDGVHVIVSEMSRWLETSLVSLGAANNAKIVSRAKSLLGKEEYEKLTASGVTPEATVLFANHALTSPKPKTPEPKMEIKELVTLNATLTGEKAVADHKVVTLTAEKAELTTQLTAEKAKVSELETKLAAVPADAVKTKADLDTAKNEVAAQLTYIRKEADRLCVAASVEKLPETATFAELTASIDANRVKLSETFGGSVPPTGKTGEAASAVKPSAFKTR